MVSVITSSVVDHGLEPWSVQTEGYEIDICDFSTKGFSMKKYPVGSECHWFFFI